MPKPPKHTFPGIHHCPYKRRIPSLWLNLWRTAGWCLGLSHPDDGICWASIPQVVADTQLGAGAHGGWRAYFCPRLRQVVGKCPALEFLQIVDCVSVSNFKVCVTYSNTHMSAFYFYNRFTPPTCKARLWLLCPRQTKRVCSCWVALLLGWIWTHRPRKLSGRCAKLSFTAVDNL